MLNPVENFHIYSKDAEKAWSLFSADSPQKFFRTMTEGLPQGTRLELSLNPNGTLEYLKYGCGNENKDFYFYNFFGSNYADYLKAHVYRSLQGKGIGRIINGHLFRLYQKIDMRNIIIEAHAIGVYAHARTGFVPTQESWDILREHIGRRLDFIEQNPSRQDGRLPSSYIDTLCKVLASDDPKSYWFIVDQEYPYFGTSLGKVLTLNFPLRPEDIQLVRPMPWTREECAWGGSLNMKDPDCIRRFEAYLYADKGQKPAVQQKPTPRQPAALGVPR